jgi:hypothetical protein
MIQSITESDRIIGSDKVVLVSPLGTATEGVMRVHVAWLASVTSFAVLLPGAPATLVT